MIEQFLPLLLIFGVMYLVLFLPQQRQKKKHASLLAGLREGDEVVLNSGIHGFVGQVDDNVLWLEVASDVELKVSKASVSSKVDTDKPQDDEDSE